MSSCTECHGEEGQHTSSNCPLITRTVMTHTPQESELARILSKLITEIIKSCPPSFEEPTDEKRINAAIAEASQAIEQLLAKEKKKWQREILEHILVEDWTTAEKIMKDGYDHGVVEAGKIEDHINALRVEAEEA